MCMSAPKMPPIPSPPAPPPPPTKVAQKAGSVQMKKSNKGPRGRSYLTIPRSSVAAPKGGVGVNV